MKTWSFIVLFILMFHSNFFQLSAQVSINTDGTSPDSSAMLDVKSTTKGMLVPRLTSAQRTAVLNPAPGLLVYDTSTQSFWFFKSGGWTELVGGGGGGSASAIHDANNDTKVQTEKYPNEDRIRFDLGGTERMVFYPNRLDLLHTNYNLFVGNNTGVGTTGTHNTGMGTNVLFSNTIGTENTGSGYGSLYYNTGDYNTAFGSQTLYYNAGGYENTAHGYLALNSNIDGSYNTGIGSYALNANTSGNRNTAVGEGALWTSGGSNNTAVGFRAGIGAGSGNVFLGYLAGNFESGSDKLYIDNSETSSPLIWGDFSSNILNINGKLGVGTIYPLNKLHVVALSNPLRLEGLQNTSQLTFLVTDENGVISKRPNAGPSIMDEDRDTKIQTEKNPDEDIIRFDLSGTEKMALFGDRLTLNGKMGIGTANPLNQLHIVATSDPLRLEGLQTSSDSYFLVVDNYGVITKRPEGGVGMGWELVGNSGLGSPANFLGTTDSASLNFRVNNQKAGSIDIDAKNTSFGYQSLFSNLTGSSNVAIGNKAGYYETGSNRFYVDNTLRGNLQDGRDKSLIYGEFATDPTNQKLALNANVGIGTSTPFEKLELKNGNLLLSNSGTASEIRFSEPTAGGMNYSAIRAQTQSEDITYTLPLTPATAGQVLSNDGTGILNWITLHPNSLIEDADHDTKVNTEKNVDEDKIRFDLGGTEQWVMTNARLEPKNSGYSVFIGDSAGYNDDAISNYNVFIGTRAGRKNTTGSFNTASGTNALFSNVANSRSTAIGYNAMYNADSRTSGTDTYNTALGYEALKGSNSPANNTGRYNTAVGDQALYSNTTGSNNTVSGKQAMYLNSMGSGNTAMGREAMYFNTSGSANTAVGLSALNYSSSGSFNTAIGYTSLYNTTSGSYNVANGFGALYSNHANSRSTAIGFNAMFNADNDVSGKETYNTAVGYEALKGGPTAAENTGESNTAIGDQALFLNTIGSSNTGSGAKALLSNTAGSYNTATGMLASNSNTLGSYNTTTGAKSLANNTTGNYNTANGGLAMGGNTTGSFNIAIGLNAFYSSIANSRNTVVGCNAMYYADNRSAGRDTYNTALGYEALKGGLIPANNTGQYNTATGDQAMSLNTSGYSNTATGAGSLYHNTEGYYNTAYGQNALHINTTGHSNIGIGIEALYRNSTKSDLVAIGDSALYNNGIGANSPVESVHNNALGSKALYSNQTGAENTAMGFESLYSNISGNDNTAFGSSTLHQNTGNGNTAFGSAALKVNSTGTQNVAVGKGPLVFSTEGTNNVAIGTYALGLNTTGNYNIGIGTNAGITNMTGYGNISIGLNSGPTNLNLDNTIAIGHNVSVDYSNRIVIGNDENAGFYSMAIYKYVTSNVLPNVYIEANGNLERICNTCFDKMNIQNLESSTFDLFALRPVSFQYNAPGSGTHFGLLADEVAG